MDVQRVARSLAIRYSVVVVFAIFIAAGFLPLPSLAATDGSITGAVTNATTGEPLAGATVVLSRFTSPTESTDSETTTDAAGRYTFAGLDTADNIVYVTSVRHAGVIYASGMLRLSAGQSVVADLTVYETTTDQSAVRVASRGIVLTEVDRETGAITCLDIFAIAFDSDRTLVQGDDGRTLRFPIPANASEVTPGTGFSFGAPSIDGSTVFATGPLYPGETTATLTWIVPYDGDQIDIELANAYPTGSIRVLVPQDGSVPDAITVNGDGFIDDGTVTIGEVEYRVWSVDLNESTSTAAFAFRSLPAFEREMNRLRTREPLLVVIVATAAAAAVTVWVIRRRNLFRPRPVVVAPQAAAQLEEHRAALVERLRGLEAEHAAGARDDASYAGERRAILLELRAISRQMRGVGDDE